MRTRVKPEDLVAALATTIPTLLCEPLVKEFMQLRLDMTTGSLGRSSPGKLVETFVQILQHLESGTHEAKPDVDEFLRKLETRGSSLDDGLRVCAARVARSMYTLRNKRTIAHIGAVDPNTYDLRLLLQGSQWLIGELLRVTSKVTMQEAGRLIEQVHEPVGGLIEDYGDRRLVLADLTTHEEVVVLLHRSYPVAVPLPRILGSLDRRTPRAVRECLRRLWKEKLVDGDTKNGYRLTGRGFDVAVETIGKHIA